MADHQLDSDSAPQRKRIAVACGRCRKRKIRCSGDPGQGQPCTNCKNAGAEPCQFLRVASREAPLRHEPGDFGYSVGDARMYAGRASVTTSMQYTQDLPTLGSSDVLGSYRGGSTYGYASAASKTYYPAMHAYGTPYADDFEFGIGVPSSQSVMHPEPVGINVLPGQWSSGARTKPPSFSSMYLDGDATYSSYHGTGLVHRPGHSVSSDSPSFSFSGVAASLPITTAPGSDRLLPNPAGRSSTLPYPAVKSAITGASTSTASTLADVATAASYAGGFDAYQSSTTSSSLSGHPSSSSRTNSTDTYSTAESIFSEQERSLQSQGPGFDMNTYTSETRRSPASAHDAAAAAHHHSSQHHITAAGYMTDAHDRHGHSIAGSGSATTHADDRHATAVATRH